MTKALPTYERVPSQKLQDLLKTDGFLRPIIDLNTQEIGGHKHNVHFRRNDEVYVYRGGTRLLTVKRYRRSGNVNVGKDVDKAYKPYGKDLFREWCVGESGFSKALHAYLRRVRAADRWIEQEGSVQTLWGGLRDPWVPFDREAVLRNNPPATPEVKEALAELLVIHQARQTEPRQRDRWAKPEIKGNKVDQLAIDQQGHLVIIELKDGSKRSSNVFYAPFQLLQYVWAWHSALKVKAVRDNLQGVIDERVKLGLTDAPESELKGGIRAAVCFGRDTRSDGVKCSYGLVLEVVNRHLPPGVAEIETWKYTDDGPRRV